MREYSIIGATFYGNRGAEAMVTTTIAALRAADSDATFNVFSYYSKKDRTLVSDPGVRFYSSSPAYLVLVLNPFAMLYAFFGLLRLRVLQRLCPASVQALARSRALICLAGVSFVDGRTKFLPFNIATIFPPMLLGTPVVKFAQALGTFRQPLNRFSARMFLPRCNRIFARGARTLDNLRDLLPRASHLERANDVAFLFMPEQSLSQRDENGFDESVTRLKNFRASDRIVVGLCPSVVVAKRARKSGWDYAAMLAKVVDQLVRDGHVVALFPNATRTDPTIEHNNDLPLLSDIATAVAAEYQPSVVKFAGILNAAQVHEVTRACDVTLVSRFHAMVGSLSLGVPVAVMGWSHKYLEVMELFDQADMVLRYEQGDAAAVTKAVDSLIAGRRQRTETIGRHRDSVRALSRRQIDYVLSLP